MYRRGSRYRAPDRDDHFDRIPGFRKDDASQFLNRILSTARTQKIAIIVNEFGEIGIDAQLVIDAQEDVLERNNGCICCTVRKDLSRAVSNLLASGRMIDRVVIETTGLADPAPVIQSFILDETLRTHTELNAIVTVADARHIVDQLHNEQAREQVAFADIILLNKIDLVSERDIKERLRLLRSLNPLARIHRAVNCGVDLAEVLDVRCFDLRNALKLEPQLLADRTHEHDPDIACISIRARGAIDVVRFNHWINGVKSGTWSGLPMGIESTIFPPAISNAVLNASVESLPGG